MISEQVMWGFAYSSVWNNRSIKSIQTNPNPNLVKFVMGKFWKQNISIRKELWEIRNFGHKNIYYISIFSKKSNKNLSMTSFKHGLLLSPCLSLSLSLSLSFLPQENNGVIDGGQKLHLAWEKLSFFWQETFDSFVTCVETYFPDYFLLSLSDFRARFS